MYIIIPNLKTFFEKIAYISLLCKTTKFKLYFLIESVVRHNIYRTANTLQSKEKIIQKNKGKHN